MVKVILHIGRHKTGTSSLQRFLYENSELLRQYDLVYPRIFIKNIAHHHLAEPFRKSAFDKLSLSEQKAQIAKARDKLKSTLTDQEVVYVISSEAFQNVEPRVLCEIFDPTVFNTKVVCYFREQISYLASAYNQRVHATNYEGSIYHYYKNYFRANYLLFANEITSYFDDFIFRIYDKDSLEGGDLIVDFLFRITSQMPVKRDYFQVDGNPSLGGKLLAVKRKINSLVNKHELDIDLTKRNTYLKLGKLSNALQGKKYKIPSLLALLVFIQHRRSNMDFSQKYGLEGALNMKKNLSLRDIFGFNDRYSKKDLQEVLDKVYG